MKYAIAIILPILAACAARNPDPFRGYTPPPDSMPMQSEAVTACATPDGQLYRKRAGGPDIAGTGPFVGWYEAVEAVEGAAAQSAPETMPERLADLMVWSWALWIPALALGVFLALYLRDRLGLYIAATAGIMMGVTYAIGRWLPAVVGWTLGISGVLLVGAVVVWIVRRLRHDETIIPDLVATVQTVKHFPRWDDAAKNEIQKMQHPITRARVAREKGRKS
jgi:hypothetical protein